MSRANEIYFQRPDSKLSKSLHQKVALSSQRRSTLKDLNEDSLMESSNKLSAQNRNLSQMLSNTVGIQRRIDQQLDVSVRKLNLQPPERDNSLRQSRIVEARKLNFEALESYRQFGTQDQTQKDDHTAIVLSRISSKLDKILKKTNPDHPHSPENLRREKADFDKPNMSYMELSAKGSNAPSKPPMPPKEFTRPVWVSFGSRSRSKASNGSNSSKEELEKKENKNELDSSISLSKKSDYQVRLVMSRKGLQTKTHILDQSSANNLLSNMKDANNSTSNISIERKRRITVKMPSQLCQTSSSLKNTNFSLLQLLDGNKLSSAKKRALRQSLSRRRLQNSGKENRVDIDNLANCTGRKQSIEDVHIEKKEQKLKKKNFSKVAAEKTFQLEDETDRKHAACSSNRFQTSTAGGLESNTGKRMPLNQGTMSIQVSKFELHDEVEASRNTTVAHFFKENMNHHMSPIQKLTLHTKNFQIVSPREEEEVSCDCHNIFSKIKTILKKAEQDLSSKRSFEKSTLDHGDSHSKALIRMVTNNKRSSMKLICLFMNRLIKGRKLSALAKIFNRYKQQKKVSSRKALVIAR